MFRSSPPEMFSKNDAVQIRNPQKKNRAETRSQQGRFATLLKSHPTDRCAPKNPQYTRRTPLPRRAPLGDCFCMSKEF